MSERPIEQLQAGNRFRETMVPKADSEYLGAPVWYGWVIMDAFLAGIDYAESKSTPPSPSGDIEKLVDVLRRADLAVAWESTALGRSFQNEVDDALLPFSSKDKETTDA